MTNAAFIDTLGVNVHIGWDPSVYGDAQSNIAMLQYLGIKHVRENFLPTSIDVYAEMANAGIDFDMLTSSGGGETTAGLQSTINDLVQLETRAPGAMYAVEGPNEVANWPISYNGDGSIDGVNHYQWDLYHFTHGQSALSNTKVFYWTDYGVAGAATHGQKFPLGPNPNTTPGYCDFDSTHAYPQQGLPPMQSGTDYIGMVKPQRSTSLINEDPPVGPAVMTETGYGRSANGDTASNSNTAKWLPLLFLDTARDHFRNTYVYQLLDQPGTDAPDMGLFDSDYHPNPVAVALHNWTTILSRGGPAASTSGAAAYTVENLPSVGDSFSLKAGDGRTYIAVWTEPYVVWQTPAPTVDVTVKLAAPAHVQVYDPTESSDSMRDLGTVSSIDLTLGDFAYILQVGP